MPITKLPLESDFGFKSPGFTVDDEGNVFVKTLTYTTESGTEIDADYFITNDGGNLVFSGTAGINPTVTLNKGSVYTFGLNLVDEEGDPITNGFYILSASNVPYSTGVKHLDATGVETVGDPFNRTDGIIEFRVPFDAPTELYYAFGSQTLKGTFVITEPESTPVGSFQNLIVTQSLTSTADDVVITLAPGAEGTVTINPNGGGSVNNVDINAVDLTATTNVNLTPTTSLVINPATTGEIDNTNIGQTIPAAGAFTVLEATGGAINNVSVGLTTPAQASFTQADVETISEPTNVTNKKYVDSIASALAIALGT
jgi:hypothetical protein